MRIICEKKLQVEDEGEGEEPAQDAAVDEAVVEQHLGGAAATGLDDGNLQIADDACQDED